MAEIAPERQQRRPGFHPLAGAIAFGFAIAVAMTTLAYLARLPGVEAPVGLVGGGLIAALALGAFLAGRAGFARSGWVAGLLTGLVAALASALILQSALVKSSSGVAASSSPSLAVAIPGWLAFAALLGAVAGIVGRSTAPAARKSPTLSSRDWLARFAIVACVAVAILLAIGGAVTSAQQGLAVPDWPTSFGANMFLLPLSKMTGGVFLEHSHRLFGTLVGLITIALALWTVLADRRKSAVALAILAFILVSAQGIMGGLRVTETSRALAAVHGFTAQGFFALMCVFAAVLAPTWRRGDRAPGESSAYGLERRLTVVALAVLVVQIALGVVARHFDQSIHGVMTHAGFSVVALIFILAAAFRVKKSLADAAPAPRFAGASLHVVGLQMLLGFLTLWQVLAHRDTDPASEALLATAHQVVGALVLGMVTLLTVWTFRLTRPSLRVEPAFT